MKIQLKPLYITSVIANSGFCRKKCDLENQETKG